MDRAKRGTKRSLLVERGGVPVALSVAEANRNDFKLLAATLQSFAQQKPKPSKTKPQHMLLDKGYDYEEVRAILQAHGLIAHIRSRGEEAAAKKKQPGKKARRRVVERDPLLVQPLPPPPHAPGQERTQPPRACSPLSMA